MSGTGRDLFNGTDQIRLGRDHVLRLCREHFTDKPDLADLVKWHHGFVIPQRMTWDTAQREARCPVATMWAVWQNKATPDQLAEYQAKIGAFRKRCATENRQPFCETTYSEIIWENCDLAAYATAKGRPTIVHIRGPSGCGKTHVTWAWYKANNHGRTIYYQPRGFGGTKQLLLDLAVLTGIDRKSNYNALGLRVFDCFEPGMVLIVDEIHLLVREHGNKQPLIDLLRRIVDLTKCSLVAIATGRKFEQDVASGHWDDVQWWRRQARTIDLPEVAADKDLGAIFEFKFPELDPDDLVRDALRIINRHRKGGFGQCVAVLDDARLLMDRRKRQPNLPDVLTALNAKLDALEIVRGGKRI